MRSQPSVGERLLILGNAKVAARDVAAADLQVAHGASRQRTVFVISHTQLTIADWRAHHHEFKARRSRRSDRDRYLPDGKRRALDGDRMTGLPGLRHADGQAGLRESVHREHRRGRQTEAAHFMHEALAKRDGNRFRAIEQQSHFGEIQSVEAPGFVELQEVLVAEIGRAEQRGPDSAGFLKPQQGTATEQPRVHDGVLDVRGKHAEVKADQSHVVRERHPA